MICKVLCDVQLDLLKETNEVIVKKSMKEVCITADCDPRAKSVQLNFVHGKHYQYNLNTAFALHSKFASEGRASIHLVQDRVHIHIKNSPPAQLTHFLRSIVLTRQGKSVPLSDVDTNSSSQQSLAKKHGAKQIIPVSPRKLTSLMDDLSSEQREVVTTVLHGKSLFFTGGAGTGKSFLIQRLRSLLPKNSTFATSTTGVAAFNIGAMTIQAFTGIVNCDEPIERSVAMARRRQEQWRACQVLIIDEISMMDAAYFDRIERVARVIKQSSKPFGGIQLVITGDFLQLPPVTKGKHGDSALPYCFKAHSWDSCIQHTIELRRVYRQAEDLEFVRILRMLRVGKVTPQIEDRLRATAKSEIDEKGIMPTELGTHVSAVDAANEKHLTQLAGPSVIFEAERHFTDFRDGWLERQLDGLCPAPQRLELKIGAQVMLLRNLDVLRGLVNGSRGVVVRFDGKTGGTTQYPVVRFFDGKELMIEPHEWTLTMSGRRLASITQMPLKLSWAISIHKSQGLTLDYVKADMSRIFAPGQAYVALSRATSLAGLIVDNFSADKVTADPEALRFYASLRQKRKECDDVDKENLMGNVHLPKRGRTINLR